MKPYAESCEKNKAPILAVLRDAFARSRSVLEIGSGTGQHCVHFAMNLPHLVWQPSDLPENHPGIRAWIAEAALPNLREPVALDVHAWPWTVRAADAVFSANTAHILDWTGVERLFAGTGRVLEPGGLFALYGPFNYGGSYTSPGNARFDAWLRSRDPASGLRDFEALDALAAAHGLHFERDVEMPSNNRTLIWRREPGGAGEQG